MILDTCALLWLASGEKKFSREVLKDLKEAPAIYVSAMSGFEIALKASSGKLKLSKPPRDWFAEVVSEHGLTILPMDLNICITAAQLPLIHRDPSDRFIIATAKQHQLAVVTSDENFEKYGVTVVC